jgi:hypothetical protein
LLKKLNYYKLIYLNINQLINNILTNNHLILHKLNNYKIKLINYQIKSNKNKNKFNPIKNYLIITTINHLHHLINLSYNIKIHNKSLKLLKKFNLYSKKDINSIIYNLLSSNFIHLINNKITKINN